MCFSWRRDKQVLVFATANALRPANNLANGAVEPCWKGQLFATSVMENWDAPLAKPTVFVGCPQQGEHSSMPAVK